MSSRKRIYLSPPDVGELERQMLVDAFDSNWIAPLGPEVDAFEREFAEHQQVAHAVALSSGTAALHLALVLLDVSPGDEVIVSDLTFAATANAVRYVGATPVFIDADRTTWNLDPELLAEELDASARRGNLPRAVIAVDLYGQACDYDRIAASCARYDVPLIEDAAEALGATYRDRPVGGFGAVSAFSFNGNKIITTSGGGMLCTARQDWAERTRYLATQARDPAPHYEHSTIGYNYRLSNLLAALGRAQLRSLERRVAARRATNAFYRAAFAELDGIEFMPEAPYGRSTNWLTCLTIDPARFGANREDVRLALERDNIEARPVWKPMHLQPVFRQCRIRGGSVSAELFERGLCLPSGSSLTAAERDLVAERVRNMASR